MEGVEEWTLGVGKLMDLMSEAPAAASEAQSLSSLVLGILLKEFR